MIWMRVRVEANLHLAPQLRDLPPFGGLHEVAARANFKCLQPLNDRLTIHGGSLSVARRGGSTAGIALAYRDGRAAAVFVPLGGQGRGGMAASASTRKMALRLLHLAEGGDEPQPGGLVDLQLG